MTETLSNVGHHEQLAQFPNAHEAYMYALGNETISDVPSVEAMAEYWVDTYDTAADMRETPGVYGIMRQAKGENPWAVASIDLCDVTRQTAASVMGLGGFTVDHIGEKYFYGTPFGLDTDPEAVVKLVQTVMVRDGIAPVAGIEDIRTILQQAREAGVYIVANTSTLAGCEFATIDWLANYLPSCFDGIVLPRNHDGTGSVTKGTAKQSVIAALDSLQHPEKIQHTAHIDDAPHHIHAVRETARALHTIHADFTPRYNWNTFDTKLNLQETPLASFEKFQDTLSTWK